MRPLRFATVFLFAILVSACSDGCTETAPICRAISGSDVARGGGGFGGGDGGVGGFGGFGGFGGAANGGFGGAASGGFGGFGVAGAGGVAAAGGSAGGSAGGLGVGGDGAAGGAPTAGPVADCARGVVAARRHTCAARGDGSIWCWGDGKRGQLGNSVSTSSLVAVQVGGIESAIAWDAYDDHSCVVAADGEVSCWGVNATGQLGDPSVAFSNTPIASVGIDNARGVAVGSHGDCSVSEASCGFSCALLAGGGVRCWGAGEQGSIGDGRNVNTHIASNVSGITSASALDAGGHVCVRVDDGSLRCWGRNTFSQLGNETLLDTNVPFAVTTVARAASVAVGAAHTCALGGGGVVRCWGANDVGQLGNGVTNIASSMAQRVTGLGEVVEIATGKGHSCARRHDGSVWCWGDNSYGQLGRGSMGTPSGVAAAVVAIAQAQDISVGDDHTCALLADDTLWCWGHNDEGQLGNGGKSDSPLPVRVQGF